MPRRPGWNQPERRPESHHSSADKRGRTSPTGIALPDDAKINEAIVGDAGAEVDDVKVDFQSLGLVRHGRDVRERDVKP